MMADIRSFTPFCQRVDSSEVALFIKKVYIKIIDEYFPDLEFYKPAGDGLLIIIPYRDEDVKEKCNKVITNCIKLVENFPTFLMGDPVINYDVPKHIGIGISRGSVCCLKSGDKIIDYSGKRINLASRLMDLARPSGVVVDGEFNFQLFPENVQSFFTGKEVYIKGVAESSVLYRYSTRLNIQRLWI